MRGRSRFPALLWIILACLLAASPSIAAESASIPVVAEIPAFCEVSLSPPEIQVKARIGLSGNEAAVGLSLSATGDRPWKLTGRLASPLPEGLTLILEIFPIAGGSSTGPQVMGTSEVDLLTGFSGLFEASGRGRLEIRAGNDQAPSRGHVALILSVREM